jgi:cell division protease FtsH
MMALASRRSQYLDGGYGMDCAQDTAARMDKAVKEILDQCYAEAVEILKANREDMDKVVAYLMEKETITGAEMVAIIEGRDPELVDDPYASTQARPKDIEAPAKKVHMISEKIEMPVPEDAPAETAEPSLEAPAESGETPDSAE